MKPGTIWPLGITAILCATVVANLFVMRLASNDPAFAVEPDYYRKAVQYDSTMAQERRNLALGWRATTTFESLSATADTRVHVRLSDTNTAPVSGTTMRLMARFNARANDTLTAVLTESTPGNYVTTLPIHTAGEWEVRVDVVRDSARFSSSQRVVAVRGGRSSSTAR